MKINNDDTMFGVVRNKIKHKPHEMSYNEELALKKAKKKAKKKRERQLFKGGHHDV